MCVNVIPWKKHPKLSRKYHRLMLQTDRVRGEQPVPTSRHLHDLVQLPESFVVCDEILSIVRIYFVLFKKLIVELFGDIY